MYYGSEESLDSQSRLAAGYSSPEISPVNHSDFRFPISSELKGYGMRNKNRFNGGYGTSNTSPPYPPVARSIKPEELYDNEDGYISTKHSDDVWHYPRIENNIPEVDYVYGAFSSGNSSIVTIESTISNDSENDDSNARRNRQDGSQADSPENDYDTIENVQRDYLKPVKTTHIIGLREGKLSPIYEVPIPEGEGEIILPTQVKKTPVFKRRGEQRAKAVDVIVKPNKETMLWNNNDDYCVTC